MRKFWEYLEKVKAYPEDTKRLIGLSVSGGLTFVIVSMSFVLPGHAVKEVVASKQAKSNAPSPFFVIQKEFSESFSKMWSEIPFPSKSSLDFLFNATSSPKKATMPPLTDKSASSTQATATEPTSTAATTTTATTTPKTEKKSARPAAKPDTQTTMMSAATESIKANDATTTEPTASATTTETAKENANI
ncbi:MAG: hypothetical protein WC878_06220 [Candidatus Paceibacterota bacterium]|jgi:hypothetical protein